MSTLTETQKTSGSFFDHPIWLAGFRPFFFLAFLSGAILPILWVFVYVGWIDLSRVGLTPFQWHSHEMLFGFGWAVLGGFLLTASKNWLKIRGLHGGPLAVAVGLWTFERFVLFNLDVTDTFSYWLRALLSSASVFYVGGYVIACLIRYREQDTFRDNLFFIFGLPVLLGAKLLILSQSYYLLGWSLSLGIFRLAFAVMFERTITQFMKNACGVLLPRRVWLDLPIKIFVFASIFQNLLPRPLAVFCLAGAGTLLLVRFLTWSPIKAFQKFEIAIMYIGYFALSVHFLFEAFQAAELFVWIGSLSVHIFTFFCMGVVIPGMMIRISQGHTGRPLIFTGSDRVALSFMFLGAVSRVVMTQVFPVHYQLWIALAGVGWSLCFCVIAFRLTRFLFQPRIDGKVH